MLMPNISLANVVQYNKIQYCNMLLGVFTLFPVLPILSTVALVISHVPYIQRFKFTSNSLLYKDYARTTNT